MPPKGYVLSERTRDRLMEVLSVTPTLIGPGAARPGGGPARVVTFVEITDPIDTDVAGYYTGVPTNYQTFADDFETYVPCLVKAANGETLEVGKRYPAMRAQDEESSGLGVFVTAALAGDAAPPSVAGSVVGSDTDGTVTLSLATTEGQLLVAFSVLYDATALASFPDGWTVLLDNVPWSSHPTYSPKMSLAVWRVDSTAPSSFVFTNTPAVANHGVGLVALDGADFPSDVRYQQDSGEDTTAVAPSAYATAGSIGLALTSCLNNLSAPTPPAGYSVLGGDLFSNDRMWQRAGLSEGYTGDLDFTLAFAGHWFAVNVIVPPLCCGPTKWGGISDTPTVAGEGGYGIETIDGIPIGGTVPAAGKFTTLEAASGINSTTVGLTTPAAAKFTDVEVTGHLLVSGSTLRLYDADGSHYMEVVLGSNLTANHTFTLTTGDADRTLDISAASVTISSFATTYLDDTTAGATLTTLGGTTVGQAFFTAANPSAIRFPRVNADNSVSLLDASTFRTAIGAGTGAGDVVGPGSATDNALARYDGTTGKLLQDSAVVVTDAGAVTATLTNATTAAVDDILTLDHESSGTPANGFGSCLRWLLEDSTTASQNAARIDVSWATATHASRVAAWELFIYDTSARSVMKATSTGAGATLGFFGATPVLAQSGDVLTGLIAFGLFGTGSYLTSSLSGVIATANLPPIIEQATTFQLLDAVTNASSVVLTVEHDTTGTAAAGFGATVLTLLETTTTPSTSAAEQVTTWVDATHASRKARVVHSVYDTAAREYLRGEASGTAAKIGFLGTAAAVQQTGDAGTALVTFGLMSGTPTFAAANLTGTTLPSGIVTSSLTSVGVLGALNVTTTDTGTNNTPTVAQIGHNSSNTPAAGFGSVTAWNLNSSTTDDTTAADETVSWVVATHASRTARRVRKVYDTAGRTTITEEASGSAAMIGFLGATASAQLASPDAGTALVTFGLASGTPTFAGANVTGTVANATAAATVASANEATDTTCFPLFITASGTQTLATKNNTSLTFNSNTGALGATTLELGGATDATLARVGANDLSIEGNTIYRVGGTDVAVADGGTGLSTLTAHALYVGNGASAPTALAVGSDGQLLLGQSTADPAWKTSSGDVTIDKNGVTTIGAGKVVASMLGVLNAFTNATPAVADRIPFYDDSAAANRDMGIGDLLPMHKNYISGYGLANNGTDANNDIDVAAGVCTDSTNVAWLVGSALTKRMDAAWAAGTNQGGMDTGSEAASTWYHVHAILKDSDLSVDYLFSASATAPTMPAGYTYFRRLGSIFNDGSSNLRAFKQDGDEFQWMAPVADINASNPGTSAVTRTLTTPGGVRVLARIGIAFDASAQTDEPGAIIISDLSVTDTAAGTANFNLMGFSSTILISNFGGFAQCWTNTSSQVRSRLQISAAGTRLRINTHGWMDPRGQDG